MLIDISGSRCVSCRKYTQHYRQDGTAVNYGFCGQFQRCTNPGRRCKHYIEKGNVSGMYRLKIIDTPPADAGRA